jgi:hypothetical protein
MSGDDKQRIRRAVNASDPTYIALIGLQKPWGVSMIADNVAIANFGFLDAGCDLPTTGN